MSHLTTNNLYAYTQYAVTDDIDFGNIPNGAARRNVLQSCLHCYCHNFLGADFHVIDTYVHLTKRNSCKMGSLSEKHDLMGSSFTR